MVISERVVGEAIKHIHVSKSLPTLSFWDSSECFLCQYMVLDPEEERKGKKT